MKQFLTILLLSLIGFTACRHHTAYPLAMQQAEQLMSTRPDSALTLLQGMADTLAALPEETQMYHQLLTIQAKDKLYITHTSDSLINRIVSFYEDYGNSDRLMMAYFYQGSTFRDMNDAPRALKAFHQTIDAGKKTKNLTLLGQAYGQMGTLFTYQHLYDEALEMKRKALQYYTIQKDSIRYPILNRDIARIYSARNRKDSALHYYQEAYNMASNMNLSRQQNNIASEIGCLYYDLEKIDTAKVILKRIISINSNATNALLYIGKIYHIQNQPDSASYFLKKVLNSKEIKHRRTAYHHLTQLSESKGNLKDALFFWKKYRLLQDSIEMFTQTENISRYHLLYRFQRTEKERDALLLDNQQKKIHLYGLATIIILMMSVCIILSMLFVRGRKMAALQTLRYNLLKKQMDEQRKLQTNERGEIIKKFRESPIFKSLNCQSYQYPYTNEEWNKLQAGIEEYFPSFVERLYMLYPNMTEQEFRVCMLLKAGTRIKDIAIITESESTAITHLRSRLYTKITGKKGTAKELDKIIADL